MGENSSESGLDEWKTIRKFVSSYDDRKHELRKTGFSLITALIAAQSILFITIDNSSSTIRAIATSTTVGNYVTQSLTNLAYNPAVHTIFDILNINTIYTSYISQTIKAVAILVTIALIFAVIYYEKGYRFYQQAAVQRALILEKKLNLQLTETISYQFGSHSSRLYESGVYFLFIGSALLLSSIATPLFFPLLLVITGLAIFFTLILTRNVKDNYRLCTPLSVMFEIYLKRFIGWIGGEKKIEDPHLDWSIDPLVCKQGDKVAITLTNLNKDNSITEFVIEKDHPNLGNLKKDLDFWYDKTKVVFFKREHVSGWRSKIPFFKCPLNDLHHKECKETPKHCHILFKIMHEEYYSRYYSSTDILHSSHKKCYGNGNRDSYVEPIPSRFQLEAGASRTWLWNTIGFGKGIYIVCTPYNTPEILTRKIKIV
jgi:hypothetical protein